MKKNIINHKYLALSVSIAATLALTGCSKAAETENAFSETESVIAIESSETTTIEIEASPKAETMSYTFTDMNATMYAKSSVNVRSLPSTDGTRLDSLIKNQAVTVTGKCNETGWYRIVYNDGEAYINNKYLSDTAVADNITSAGTGTEVTSTDTNIELMTAAIEQFGMNIIIYDNEIICDSTTGRQIGVIKDGQISVVNDGQVFAATTTMATMTDGFHRAAAEQIWAYMNEERVAAGLHVLEWKEDIYNYACERAQAIVTAYGHNADKYGENILRSSNSSDPYYLHMLWHDSPDHHENYMSNGYDYGACAVYVYNGTVYAVENFIMGGLYAVDTWTASNGVVVSIMADGGLMAGDGVHSLEELQAAMNEYDACH